MPPPHALLSSPLHRIPTKWSLFRPLLRAARSAPLDHHHRDALYAHVRHHFKHARGLGSVERARRKLVEAEQFLHQLDSASHSSTHLDRLRALASHLLLRQPPPPPRSSRSSAVPTPSPSRKPKPFLSPSILPSTSFHPPLSRLRPQPLATSMMIHRRRRASQKRYDTLDMARDMVELGRAEDEFERAVGVGMGGGERGEGGRWGDEWRAWMVDAREKEAREQARNALVVPPELQRQAREAARERERRRVERAAAARERERRRRVE
ncbi:hypothetical protein JCM8208_004434 [Rhodotorula glutinis]